MAAVLELRMASVFYRTVRALNKISFRVEAGEVVGIIGPNGSGKTTLLRALAGLAEVRGGHLFYQGKDITHYPAHARVRGGIVFAPERARLVPEMTVLENLLVGAYLRRDRQGVRNDLERVFRWFPALGAKKGSPAGALSGGEKQMLVLGRALMARPHLLLLDEPFFGLGATVKEVLLGVVREIRQGGTPVVIADHDLGSLGKVAERITALRNGRVVREGTVEGLLEPAALAEVYS